MKDFRGEEGPALHFRKIDVETVLGRTSPGRLGSEEVVGNHESLSVVVISSNRLGDVASHVQTLSGSGKILSIIVNLVESLQLLVP